MLEVVQSVICTICRVIYGNLLLSWRLIFAHLAVVTAKYCLNKSSQVILVMKNEAHIQGTLNDGEYIH